MYVENIKYVMYVEKYPTRYVCGKIRYVCRKISNKYQIRYVCRNNIKYVMYVETYPTRYVCGNISNTLCM